jgi:hypothetical protein
MRLSAKFSESVSVFIEANRIFIYKFLYNEVDKINKNHQNSNRKYWLIQQAFKKYTSHSKGPLKQNFGQIKKSFPELDCGGWFAAADPSGE